LLEYSRLEGLLEESNKKDQELYEKEVKNSRITGIVLGETPSEYYSRTLDTNPGIRTLDIIGNSVGMMLRLPESDYVV